MRIGDTIYLDHQASTPVDARVFSEMAPYFGESFGNPHSTDHVAGWRAAQAVEGAAARVAQLIRADADEIIFTSGATEANNLALLGLGRRAAGGKRRRFLVSAVEHKSVLAVSRVLRDQLGYQLDSLPVDRLGRVNLSALRDLAADDVLAVSVMAVNNETGTIEDIPAISSLLEGTGIVLHCDAAQAPCAIDLGHFNRHVHLLSLSGHKMYGPQGIGALFVRREIKDALEPLQYGGGQQQELRSGTVPVPLCVGMGAAAALLGGAEANAERERLRLLRDKFVRGMMELPWRISLNGAAGAERHPGNANLQFEGFTAHNILGAVQPRLAASTGSACTSGIPEPSHVLKAVGLSAEQAAASIRFSIGRYTTEQDVDAAIDLVKDALSRLADANMLQSA